MIPVNVLGSNCNVPAAQAYVFNATVVPQSGPMGYLTLWPDAEGMPVVSTLNAYDGAVTSNMAIVPTLNGDVDAFAYNPTNLIMDIFSYFAPVQPLTITTAALPNATLNYGYGATLTAAGGVQPYSWSLTSGSLPNGLGLNSQTGMISGTPTVTGNYPFTVQVTDSESQPASISAGLAINVAGTLAQLTITTASLPSGTQNSPYVTALAATGGVTPYTWSIASGILPSGLNLNPSTGVIGGTPNGGGVSNFTVKVTDSELPSASTTAAAQHHHHLRGAIEHHHDFIARRNYRLGLQRSPVRHWRRLSLFLEHLLRQPAQRSAAQPLHREHQRHAARRRQLPLHGAAHRR